MDSLYIQLLKIFVIALPVASIAWTVTHEEIFREPREYCIDRSKTSKDILLRKFFYLFTCEYCFSHYLTALMLLLTQFKLIFDDYRGYIISFFALVFIANVYMTLYGLLRQNLKSEKIKAELKDSELKEIKEDR